MATPNHVSARRRLGTALLFLALLITCEQGLAQFEAGIIVEQVTKGSAGDKAGFQEGDLLLRWTRGDAHGQINSPFDLSMIEAEQGPRGPVVIDGLRGTKTHAWIVGADDWGIRSRPDFATDLLTLYQEGEVLARAGNTAEASSRWLAAATKTRSTHSLWLLLEAADSQSQAKQWKQADIVYQEALQQASVAEPAIKIRALDAWAESFYRRGDWDSASKYLLAAVEECQKTGMEELTKAAILTRLGVLASIRDDIAKSEEYHRQALMIRQKLAPDSLVVAESLDKLSNEIEDRGDLVLAEDYLHQALTIKQRLAPASLTVANSLVNLGNVLQDLGELAAAEGCFRQALAIAEHEPQNKRLIAITLNNLSNVFDIRGDISEAEVCQLRALAIRQEFAPGGLGVAASLHNLGSYAREQGNLAKAQEYLHQALSIRQKFVPEGMPVASTMDNLGLVAQQRHDFVTAEQYFQHALAIQQKQAFGSLEFTRTLGYLGDLEHERGNLAKAESYHRQSLSLWQKLAPGSTDHAECLAALAGIARDQQQTEVAAELYAQALNALESLTARLGGAAESKANFRAKHAEYYDDYVDLLLEHRQPELAFQVLERSRARMMLDMLAAARVDIRKGIDPALVEEERSLRRLLNAKSQQRVGLLSGRHTEEQMAAFNAETNALLARYKDVEIQIRASSPAYAALTQPQPLGAKQVQLLLDADTLLLEYSLGRERSHVFALTVDSLEAYQLPKREEIESAARRLYQTLRRDKEENLSARARRILSPADTQRDLEQALAVLSRVVLLPVAQKLRHKRLLIVSDGILQYIPFAVLSAPNVPDVPKTKGAAIVTTAGVPLIAEHEIVDLPSASVLAALRQAGLAHKRPAKTVAVLADPVFDKSDNRVTVSTDPEVLTDSRPNPEASVLSAGKDSKVNGTLTRSLADFGTQTGGEFHLSRLPYSRREAQAILAVTPAGEGMQALDFDASRTTATGATLEQYRVVHFATHGLLDSEHPELSGLVLSLVDQKGNEQDGFLGLQDIYNLNLPADLVVLSACETGLGKEVKGEGLLGLTRGFMYAGAARVLASVWKVDDEGTAELMKKFYKEMLLNGQRPAQALRTAQLWMRTQKRWRSPYYWAGFKLQGEWQ